MLTISRKAKVFYYKFHATSSTFFSFRNYIRSIKTTNLNMVKIKGKIDYGIGVHGYTLNGNREFTTRVFNTKPSNDTNFLIGKNLFYRARYSNLWFFRTRRFI